MARSSLCSILLLAAGASLAQPSAADQERAELAARRAAIEAQHASALQDCARRFDVNACELEARRLRREALKPVGSREQALDAQERAQRAKLQRERVLQKQRDFASEDAQRKQESLLEGVRPASAPSARASAAASPDRKAKAATQAREQAARAEQSRVAAERRRREAAEREQRAREHRAVVLEREQARARKGSPAASLPLPSASDIAALPRPPASGAKP